MLGKVMVAVVVGGLAASGATAGGNGRAEYEACMTNAAVEASYTDVSTKDVYGVARNTCARGRAARAAWRLDSAETARAEMMAAVVDTMRTRRRGLDALYGLNTNR